MTDLSAVVLAAGEGERLRPMTYRRPKPLLPAGNRPIIDHVLDTLVDAGIDDLCLVVGYESERVQNHVGSTYRDTSVNYVKQETQLGSGHALLQAEKAIDDSFVVVYGDQIVASSLVSDVIDEHDGQTAPATLAALDDSRAQAYDGIKVDDGRVVDIAIGPDVPSNYSLNAGVYAFEPAIFASIRDTVDEDGTRTLPGAINTMLDRGEHIKAVEAEGLWVDANYPWDLLTVARQLFAHNVIFDTQAGIPDSATVHDSATIRGSVSIDADAVVGPGAVLGPNVCLGENATVEANAVVENAVIDADARVGPNATLIDAVLGQGAHLGAAGTVAGGPGDIRIGTRVFEDEPLGAVIADRARLGGDISVAPGTLVGPDVTAETGVTLQGTIAPGREVVK